MRLLYVVIFAFMALHADIIIKPTTETKTQIIYLHGLIEGDVEQVLEQEAKAWQPLVDKYNFTLVMPVGTKGAFPDQPEAYAWGTSDISRVRALAQNSDYAQSILFGYSNGAFLVGQILQQTCDTPFSGYWLQGGGNAQEILPCVPHKPVVLQIGVQDTHHLQPMQWLKSALIKHGWQENKTLLYQEMPGCHAFTLDHFDEAYRFITGGIR